MICPNCKTKIPDNRPTLRQLLMFIYVHKQGMTQEQTALIMGVSQPCVCKSLRELRRKMPYIFPDNITPKQFIRYDDTIGYDIRIKV